MWSEDKSCQTRHIWIDTIGIPPHAWKTENIQNIIEIWGDLVGMEMSTSEAKSFVVPRALIDTMQMAKIDDETILFIINNAF